MAMEYELEYENYRRGSTSATPYVLPDGTPLDLYEECIKSTEALFNPILVQKYNPGLSEILISLVHNLDQRKERNYNLNQLLNNIVLSGGGTNLMNFGARLQKDLLPTIPHNLSASARIVYPESRKDLSWKGGSLITQLGSFLKMWVSRVDYEEYGPGIIHRKCNTL